MSGVGYNGYYLHKTGERVSELLERDYIVPTLKNTPNETTLFWKDGKYTHLFSVGDFIRVIIDSNIKLYRLLDIKENKALWKEVILEHQDITGKQDVINDLETIRSGAALGTTALQEVPEEYITETELEEKGYLTEHQDISSKQDVLVSGHNIKTINGVSILGSGNITISGSGTGGGSEVIILTQSEYDSLVLGGNIKETSIYFIKEDNTPVALYIGSILIAQKDELGNISFPYNFPIIF